MDKDLDSKLTVEEIKDFAKKTNIFFDDSVYHNMFNEIVQYRKIITEEDKVKPLTMEEIHKAGIFFKNKFDFIKFYNFQ